MSEDQLAIMMGRHAAEQLMVATISSGAVDDFQRASQLAKRMVTEFGMGNFTEPLEKFLLCLLSPFLRDDAPINTCRPLVA